MQFEWDPKKAVANLQNHGVSFDEATTVFGDPLATTVFDPEHSDDEDRLLTTGMSKQQRFVIVWHTDESGTIRIIGARSDTPRAEDL